MTLSDTGPLVPLLDRNNSKHRSCLTVISGVPGPLLTTWACMSEAMHLLGRVAGHRGQEALWSYVADGVLLIHAHGPAEWPRMRTLMAKYSDTPMDLGDASLVATAEVLGMRRIFALDSDFDVYRTVGRQPFERVP